MRGRQRVAGRGGIVSLDHPPILDSQRCDMTPSLRLALFASCVRNDVRPFRPGGGGRTRPSNIADKEFVVVNGNGGEWLEISSVLEAGLLSRGRRHRFLHEFLELKLPKIRNPH